MPPSPAPAFQLSEYGCPVTLLTQLSILNALRPEIARRAVVGVRTVEREAVEADAEVEQPLVGRTELVRERGREELRHDLVVGRVLAVLGDQVRTLASTSVSGIRTRSPATPAAGTECSANRGYPRSPFGTVDRRTRSIVRWTVAIAARRVRGVHDDRRVERDPATLERVVVANAVGGT